MNCENCGAPMRLQLEKQQFVCDYCSTIYFPHANEDGVQVLDEASDLHCPVCKSDLVYGFIDQTQVLHCKSCRGLLINQESFLMSIEYLRATSTKPPVPPPPVNFAELERHLVCPTCNQQMSTHLYGGPGNLVVDNCPTCLHIWLDNQEFTRIIRSPSRERQVTEDEDSEED